MEQNTFIVDQKHLTHMLTFMQAICAKRTTLDATTAVLFQAGRNELILKSTDLELSLQYSCPLVTSGLEQQQQFLVPGRRLFELTKDLDGEIDFNVQTNNITLSSGNAQVALNIKDPAEFPPFPERIENLLELQTVDLLNMIERVAFIIPQNNANPALNGVLFELDQHAMVMTATDGHCLAQASTTSYTSDQPRKWLLPRRAIFELKKILDSGVDKKVFLGLCGNQVVFSGESFNLFTKLLVDAFPEYQQILRKEGFVKRSIAKQTLLKTLRRAACLLSGQFIATEFNFNDNTLEIQMTNKEVGRLTETLALQEFVEGALTIHFYAPYVLEGVQMLPGDSISFWLSTKIRPIIFEATENNCTITYLVMPVSPVTL
jgi:DNA polymerase-3 subunit beta